MMLFYQLYLKEPLSGAALFLLRIATLSRRILGFTASPRLIWALSGGAQTPGFSTTVIRFVVERSKEGPRMSHAYQLNDEVLHRGQGPQGRVQVEMPKIYTIVQCMPVESDGRLRYRIKSDKIERVVTEDELSYCQ